MNIPLGNRLFVPKTFAIDRYPHAWHDSSFLAMCGNYGASTCFTPPAPPSFILQKLTDKADLKFERPIIYQILVPNSVNDGSLFEAAVKAESLCDGISLNFSNNCVKHPSKFVKADIDEYIQHCMDFADIITKIVTNVKVPIVCQLIAPGTDVGPDAFLQKYVALLHRFNSAGVRIILLNYPWRPLSYVEEEKKQAFAFLVKKIRKLVPNQKIYMELDAINNKEIEYFEHAAGTDGIALHESALYDPRLFVKSESSKASVFDVSNDYLFLADSHNTDVRLVKNHLLMLWSNVFTEQRDLQERLSKCTDLAQCKELVSHLPVPGVPAGDRMSFRCQCLAEAARKETSSLANAFTDLPSDLIEKELSNSKLADVAVGCIEEEPSCRKANVDRTAEHESDGVLMLCGNCAQANRLPLWVCHARRKLKPPNRDEASGIGSASATVSSVNKRLLRREKHFEEKREHNRRMRKIRKERAKAAKKEGNVNESETTLSKRQSREEMSARLEIAQTDTGALRICIDLEWAAHLSKKEQCRLGQQLCRVYGANRKARRPARLHVTSMPPTTSPFYEIIQSKTSHAFHTYTLSATERAWREVFPAEEVVYLSPDAPQPLDTLSPGRVYVIGGIVDETKRKNCTQTRAAELGLQTYRLPIDEYMEKDVKGTYCKVLTVNQVFEILLTFGETGSWPAALSRGIPQRAGFIPKKIS